MNYELESNFSAGGSQVLINTQICDWVSSAYRAYVDWFEPPHGTTALPELTPHAQMAWYLRHKKQIDREANQISAALIGKEIAWREHRRSLKHACPNPKDAAKSYRVVHGD